MKTLRNYFSWSQYNLWNTSVRGYYLKYILGEDDNKTNKRFEKGKELGKYKETGEMPSYVRNPDMLEIVADAIDSLEIMEHKIECEVGGVKLLSYIDSGRSDYSVLFEYKTGKEPWTQERVELAEQLDFYALMYYLASGEKTIPIVKLWWAETEDIENEKGEIEIVYTGHVESFERIITMDDIVLMLSKILKCVEQIELFEYKEHEINSIDSERYVFLKQKIKEYTEEAALLNLKIGNDLIKHKVSFGKSNNVIYTLSKTKKYIYSEEILTKEEKYKNEIKHEKDLAKKQEKAKITVSTSLRYNITKENKKVK